MTCSFISGKTIFENSEKCSRATYMEICNSWSGTITCSKLKFATTVLFYIWQSIVKSLHNKLLTTDLFLLGTSREKNICKWAGGGGAQRASPGAPGSKAHWRRDPRRSQSVSLGWRQPSLSEEGGHELRDPTGQNEWKEPNWTWFAWLCSPQLWLGKIAVDGFQLLVHRAIREKAISWGCKTVHKELPKGPLSEMMQRQVRWNRVWSCLLVTSMHVSKLYDLNPHTLFCA